RRPPPPRRHVRPARPKRVPPRPGLRPRLPLPRHNRQPARPRAPTGCPCWTKAARPSRPRR
ncbi:hypothetical protein FHD67_06545, partial [Paracoccus haeundaensis]